MGTISTIKCVSPGFILLLEMSYKFASVLPSSQSKVTKQNLVSINQKLNYVFMTNIIFPHPYQFRPHGEHYQGTPTPQSQGDKSVGTWWGAEIPVPTYQ